jgi:hypothetical protein
MDKNTDLINKIKELGYDVRQIGYKDHEHAERGVYNYRYWIIPEENYKLKNTKFYYDKENDFIHFTSIEALFSILNSKHIRLYNLVNMDDKYELDYALKALSFINAMDINKTKEGLFILSMCSSSEILNEEPKKKKHLLWKLHGRDGKGVIVRLKIENDLGSWYNYYLTKCFYTLENFNSIAELHAETQNELLDIKIASFIKLPIYDFENEVRLVFDNNNSGWRSDGNNNRVYPIIYPDKLNKTGNISYCQLPLYNFFENDSNAYPTPPNGLQLEYEIPKIRIMEVILGYRYSDEDLNNIKEKIKMFDQSITVRHSDLRQFYT